MSSSSINNNNPHQHTSNDEDEYNSGSDFDSDDDEIPELVDLANIGDETDDETDDDEQETDSDDIRVTVLPARLLIPLQIWDDEEEASEEEKNEAISIDTQQQRDRRGWSFRNLELYDRYLGYDAGNDPFLARIISHQPMYLPSFP